MSRFSRSLVGATVIGASVASLLPIAAASAAEEVAVSPVLVMSPGTSETLGGWTEVGRASPLMEGGGSISELRDIQASADRLIVLATTNEPDEGPSHDVIYHSTDGVTWLPATVPGTDPSIEDLATTSDGFIAAGGEGARRDQEGRIWKSPDGIAWTQVPAPDRPISQIVSAADPLAVVANDRLWVNRDGTEWTRGTRLRNARILRGPSGFLMWQGGGQDRTLPTVVLHSADLTAWNEVGLPRPLGRGDDASAGISIFALPDRWVLVPSEVKLPDTIYTSTDGLDWQEAPRPELMMEGAVSWMADVDGEVNAFGAYVDGNLSPSGLWAWQLGEPGGQPAMLSESADEHIDAPVAWQGGYVAPGNARGPESHLSLWSHAAPTDS